MPSSQEALKNIGNMCYGRWTHQGNPARKKKIGILLVIIGLIWLGARVGLLDLSWLQVVPFWPLALILLGVLMIYKGLRQGKTRIIDDNKEEV
jgi:uncharacterized membrane protein YoaK (UPF0700 family)